jgi:LysM repeat protein
MWKNFISSVKNNFKDILSEDQISENVFQYSQIQYTNTNKTKSCHEYELNDMFPFKKTKILKKETLDSLSEDFHTPTRELLTINNIPINNIYTEDHPQIKTQIAEKFKPGKFILVPAKTRIHRPIRDRLVDLSVKDIKEFKMEKTMLRLDQPTYFCYFCTINGDILGKLTFCENSLVFCP